MDPVELEALARVEETHWFYSGKREIVRRWLARLGPWQPGDRLVDVGAGTGLFAAEMSREWRVVALDPEPRALQFMRTRARLPAVAAAAGRLPLATGSVAALTALDVVEHLDDDTGALHEFARVVRPGGVIVLTVPAFQVLWSEWDEALHHRRRYTRGTLKAALRGVPADTLHLSYINTAAFPPVLAYRMARRWGLTPAGARLEDGVPPAALNRVLRAVFVRTALWRVPMPFGVSLLCLLRRRTEERPE
jgi:ubiquinone/menaquinone biosynthesis C-methylase UbiE